MQDGFIPDAVLIRGHDLVRAAMDLRHALTRRKGKVICRRSRRWLPNRWHTYMVQTGRTTWWLIACKPGFGSTVWSTSHHGYTVPWWPALSYYGDLAMMKRRSAPKAADAPHHLAALESNVLSKCLPLIQHCAVTKYDDGEARQPGWWTVRTRGSAWEIEIKDPETCSRLVVIQATLDDALALATVLLETEDAPWEPDPWLAKSKAQKSKK